ncbi:hypothetical protein ACHAP5_005025 [Fusarium lateritium]
MVDDQETVKELWRKFIQNCKNSTGRVCLSERGSLVFKLDADEKFATGFPGLVKEHSGDKQRLLPIDKDGDPTENSATISHGNFTEDHLAKEVNDDKENFPSTGRWEHSTPMTANDARQTANSHEGNTRHESPPNAQRQRIEMLQREEARAESEVLYTKASIKALQIRLEELQARVEPEQAHLVTIRAKLFTAKLFIANNNSDIS